MLKCRNFKLLFTISILFLPNIISFGVFNERANSLMSISNSFFETETQVIQVKSPDLTDPIFTLNALSYNGFSPGSTSNWSSCFPILKTNLEELNINLDLTFLSWPQFINQVITNRDFDLTYLEYGGSQYYSPDDIVHTIYSENSTYNTAGYDTSYDWFDIIGTGINEWYLNKGLEIFPPYSQERIDHYKEWQNYIMEYIHSVLPAFTDKLYSVYWSPLTGFNLTEGLIQSWGKMDWSSLHPGQNYTNEFVSVMYPYENLNPIYESDNLFLKEFFEATMDSLIWFDSDERPWPHLASSWTDINDTHIRFSIREGVKWQNDTDEIFTNEYLDVDDVYFTLFCYKEINPWGNEYDWIKDIKKVDQYTIDIFIDNDPGTPENEPSVDNMRMFDIPIFPEHYLNQTQELDGITPDITHSSWMKFNQSCFGTGMLEIDSVKQDEIKLTKFNDSWKYDSYITSDPDLNWVERFGTAWALDTLIFRIISDGNEILKEFDEGQLDYVDFGRDLEKRDLYLNNASLTVDSRLNIHFGLFTYNINEARGTPLQNRDPCPGDQSMEIGLAIRKAISYAIDRDQMNLENYNGELYKTHWPIFPTMAMWLSDDIPRFERNITKAK
ncbi:MAG: hypothetical protein FK733_17045, partial [Asgard group archaeon]|nr:hypothetical protein [Asgard group archaeon]